MYDSLSLKRGSAFGFWLSTFTGWAGCFGPGGRVPAATSLWQPGCWAIHMASGADADLLSPAARRAAQLPTRAGSTRISEPSALLHIPVLHHAWRRQEKFSFSLTGLGLVLPMPPKSPKCSPSLSPPT